MKRHENRSRFPNQTHVESRPFINIISISKGEIAEQVKIHPIPAILKPVDIFDGNATIEQFAASTNMGQLREGRAVKQRFTLTGYQCNRQKIRVYEEYHPFQEVNRRSPREREQVTVEKWMRR